MSILYGIIALFWLVFFNFATITDNLLLDLIELIFTMSRVILICCLLFYFHALHPFCPKCFSDGRDTDISTVSQNSSWKEKHWVRQISDLEKLICDPQQTNNEHQEDCTPLPTFLERIRTMKSSRYKIVLKPLCQQMKKISLVCKKSLRDVANTSKLYIKHTVWRLWKVEYFPRSHQLSQWQTTGLHQVCGKCHTYQYYTDHKWHHWMCKQWHLVPYCLASSWWCRITYLPVLCDVDTSCAEYVGESAKTFGEKFKEQHKVPFPIYDHANNTGHHTSVENFSIEGREAHAITRTIREAMYKRVNDQSLSRNIGKFQLSHIWDEALFNTLASSLSIPLPNPVSHRTWLTPPPVTQGAKGLYSLCLHHTALVGMWSCTTN